jgi:hypothetical protein
MREMLGESILEKKNSFLSTCTAANLYCNTCGTFVV